MEFEDIGDTDSNSEFGIDEDCFCLDSSFLTKTASEIESEDEFSFDVLSTEDVVNEMLKSIKEINTVVKIPPTVIRILLNYFNWDKEKLYERYYDGDSENLLKEAHIVYTEDVSSKNKMKPSKKTHELCEICYCELPSNLMTSLACGHRYCNQCWTMYITTKIMDQGEVQFIPCFDVDCDIIVDDQTIMDLIVDPNVKLKYQNLITNNFIMCNRHLKHCPKPGCTKVIKVQYVNAHPVTCSCGYTFCFSCTSNWHDPVPCQLLKRWQQKCDEDSATLNWIAAHTKECPCCNVRIEKNGGCNHMLCRNQQCKYEFCWICLRDWKTHGNQGWDSCYRFQEDMIKSKEQSQSSLQKYMFYYDRYMNHIQSLKFENQLYLSAELKMKELQQQNVSWFECQFLKKAVDVLCECRQTLMYTYVFAYYLVKNNAAEIFKANQCDLQAAVERLSEFLEQGIAKDSLMVLKQTIQDMFRYCDHRRKVLLNHVHEGNYKDIWEYDNYK